MCSYPADPARNLKTYPAFPPHLWRQRELMPAEISFDLKKEANNSKIKQKWNYPQIKIG